MATELDMKDPEAIQREVSEKAQELIGKAVDFAREQPHVAVGAAFAVGWVLGNGLPPRLVMAAARIGWKAAIGTLVASGGLASLMGEGDEAPAAAPVRRSAPKRSESTKQRASETDRD